MARDWHKVALAVVAAAALVSVCARDWQAAAQQPTRAGKAATKSKQPPKGDSDDGEKAAAKKKRPDPADAQRAIEQAAKLLQTGKSEQAEQVLSSTLAAGSLPPAIMARALYLRGMAYREQKKPAQAISDLTSALWLKGGLTAEDRADALKQRTAAYADAGLTETGALASTSAGEPARPSAGKSWGTVTTPTSEPSSTSAQGSGAGGGNWFKNWFGAWSSPGGETSAKTAPASAPAATASIDKADSASARPSPGTQAPRISTAWSSKTEVRPAEAPVRTSAPAGDDHKAAGKYRVQLATVRTQREAQALAAKAKQALGALAQDPEIDQAVLGNMGSFYRVRVGPFATIQEAQAVCAKVKGSGFDCLAVNQ